MAEHVAGAAMMVTRVLAAAIGGIPGAMLIVVKRRNVMAVLRLACGRLPSKTGRKQGRQENGEQCRSDVFGGATHWRIHPYRIKCPDYRQVFCTTMFGNLEVMSFCDSAIFTAQRRAMRR